MIGEIVFGKDIKDRVQRSWSQQKRTQLHVQAPPTARTKMSWATAFGWHPDQRNGVNSLSGGIGSDTRSGLVSFSTPVSC